MRAAAPVMEHVLLVAAMFAMFVMSYTSFFKINETLFQKEAENTLTLMSEKVAKSVILAYELGSRSGASEDPVVTIDVELPATLSQDHYIISYYDGKIRTDSMGKYGEAELLGISGKTTIQGRIKSSSSKVPQVKYYRESNVIILGYDD